MDRQDWKDLLYAVAIDARQFLGWAIPITVFVIAVVVLMKG